MWSLVLRISLAVGAAVAVGYGISRFVSADGVTVINFKGRELLVTDQFLLLALIGIVLLCLGAVLLLRGIGWLLSFAPYFEARRRRRGVRALSQALVALSEGDGERARKAARDAEKILDEPDLTRIVNAQAARLAGKDKEAEEYYEAMSEDKDTAFIGLVGLLGQALRDRMPERALRLAERAHALKPREPQVIDAMFDLQLAKGDWEGARNSVKAAVKAGRLIKDVAARRRAVLHVCEAQEAEGRGEAPAALDAAMAAVKAAPSLTPAATTAARLLRGRGEMRSAARILIRAWKSAPHPKLAEEFAALDPEETPATRLARFEQLFEAHPEHRETRETKAEIALAADDPEVARRALGDLPNDGVSARACALMAAVEEAQGADETIIRAWLERAAAAPRRAQWTCSACGAPSADWRHSCGNCGAFDVLEWRMVEHPAAQIASPGAGVSPASIAAPNGAYPNGLDQRPSLTAGPQGVLPKSSGGALIVRDPS